MQLLKGEPAVVIGTVISVLTFALEAVAGAPTWKAALPALASAVIRRFVSPAVKVSDDTQEIEAVR